LATIRLQRIDETTRGDHLYLDDSDVVYYWREYTARKGWSYSETNQLIKNFKITPAEIKANANRRHFKKRALAKLASEVASLIIPTVVRDGLTIVPVPPSKLPGHPAFDSRIQELLTAACADKTVDVRPLIRHSANDGTHFKVAKKLLTAMFPEVPITGVFISRRVQPPIADEFEIIDDE
jgi:hypothetical protein